MNRTGKLAEAAIANASDTMNAMFCFSKRNTQYHGNHTQNQGGDARYFQLGCAVGFTFLITVEYKSCDTADAPDRVKPATTAKDGCERYGRMKAQEDVATNGVGQVNRSHVTTAFERAFASRNSGLVNTKVIAPKPMMNVRM